MTSASPVSHLRALSNSDGASAQTAWIRLAPALLLSVAVHTAAITSLERFTVPLGSMHIGAPVDHTLRVALAPRALPVASDAAATQAADSKDTAQANDTAGGDHTRPAHSSPAIASPGMPLAIYFFAKDEVDRPATAISDVMLRYPREAFAAGTHGTVILEVFIDQQGSVARTRVVEAVPQGIFEDAAQEAIAQLRYRPAYKDGGKVRSRRLVQVVFDPNPALIPPRNSSAGYPRKSPRHTDNSDVSHN